MSIVKSFYPDVDIPDDVTLHCLIWGAADKYLDTVAFVEYDDSRQVTYQQFKELSHAVGSALYRRGLRQGDVICIYSPNTIDFPLFFIGALSIGCTITTANSLYKAGEILHQLEDTGTTYLCTSGLFLPVAKEVSKTYGRVKEIFVFGDIENPDVVAFSSLLSDDGSAFPNDVKIDSRNDTAAVLYSSGTTGLPKGVVHTHRSLCTCVLQMDIPEMTSLRHDGTDVYLAVLPFFHIYGLMTYNACLPYGGATTVILPRFDVESFLKTIEMHRVNVLNVVPPIAVMLAKHPSVLKYDLSSIRTIICGAAPLKKELSDEITTRMGVTDFRQVYGMTEVTGTHIVPVEDPVPGSAGVLVPNTECKIVELGSGKTLGPGENGEVYVRGPTVMKCYLNNPEATADVLSEDGWLRTGDIGHHDDKGHLWVVDRLKELIKYNAYQVAPAELENLLLQNEAVVDAAVIGLPDERAGELPAAYVIKRPSCDVTEAQIASYIEDRVAPYKKLRGGVHFVAEIPRASSGKILRRCIKEKVLTSMKS